MSYFDLLYNYPLLGPEAGEIVNSLSQHIAAESVTATRFSPVEGLLEHRSIVAKWLSSLRYPIPPEQIAFAVSGHHALSAILLSHTKAGQAVACDSITYNGWINICRHTERRPIPVAGDEHGMLPEALDQAASQQSIWGVFLMPSLHNPTATVMPIERRRALVEVCRKHNLWVIDDDAYRFLNPNAADSFAHLYPEKSFWIQSLTKPLFASIKTAFIVAPEKSILALAEGLRCTGHQPSLLTMPWVLNFISSGKLDSVIKLKLNEAKKRQASAKEILQAFEYKTTEHAFHLWLTLPNGWTSISANEALRNAGVAIVPGVNYSVDASDPKKIRIALAGEENRDRVAQGLQILAKVLKPKA